MQNIITKLVHHHDASWFIYTQNNHVPKNNNVKWRKRSITAWLNL